MRLLVHQLKIRSGDRPGGHALRRSCGVAHRHPIRLVSRDRAHGRMIVLERTVVDDREAESERRTVGIEPDQRPRVGVRQRIDEDRADDGGDARRRAEPDANGEHDSDRHGRCSRQAADAVDHIAPEMSHRRDPLVNNRANPIGEQVQGIEQALTSQPAVCHACSDLPPAQLMKLRQIAFDRPAIAVADQPSEHASHG